MVKVLSPPQRLLRNPGEREIKRVESGGEKYQSARGTLGRERKRREASAR